MNDLIRLMRIQETFSWERFAGRNAAFQPAYTWVWNAPVRREEVRKQLDDMFAAGIQTIYILPEPENFRAYNKRIHMEQEYLSEAFFAELRYAIEYALSIGMNCWMYDEGGWPSGSACGQVISKHPELCRKSIDVRQIPLKAGEAYSPGEYAIAAFAEDSDGAKTMVSPGTKVESGCCLAEYYVQWHAGMVVDSLDEDVGEAFVASTHEKYREFLGDLFPKPDENGGKSGRDLPMMFTDEPGAGRYAWPRNFEDRFRKRFGYDIAPFVPVIRDDGADADEAGIQARIDYRQLAGEMFRDHYFRPIHEWCRKNNILSTGHLDIDHRTDGCLYHNYGSVLNQLREMDVPGIDVIWSQITRPANGGLACAEGNGFFERFASSAAAQSGGKLAVSESFAVYGAGLVGEEMRYVINHQLVRGINLFNFMSASFGKQDAIPLVMRPAFVSEMPGYSHLRAVNDYTARACYLMQLGEPGVRAALYLPNRDLWAGGKYTERAAAAFDEMGRSLEAQQIEFDVIDDDGIRMAELAGDELRLGRARYQSIYVPECRFMPEDVKQIIHGMKQTAEPVIACSSRDIRVRTRNMEDGSLLLMLFNESGKTQQADIGLPESDYVYLLDAENARAEKAEHALNGLMFAPGEARFYLLSRSSIPEAEDPCVCRKVVVLLDQFTFRKKRGAWLDQNGIHDRAYEEEGISCGLGCWQTIVGAAYSGEAVYSAQVRLHHPLEARKLYELDLGRVECSARVTVNGKEAGFAWAEPKRVIFDGELAEGDMLLEIEIEVANTLANQYNRIRPESMHPASEIGPYQERLQDLEANAPVGGLYGPVILSEMICRPD